MKWPLASLRNGAVVCMGALAGGDRKAVDPMSLDDNGGSGETWPLKTSLWQG